MLKFKCYIHFHVMFSCGVCTRNSMKLIMHDISICMCVYVDVNWWRYWWSYWRRIILYSFVVEEECKWHTLVFVFIRGRRGMPMVYVYIVLISFLEMRYDNGVCMKEVGIMYYSYRVASLGYSYYQWLAMYHVSYTDTFIMIVHTFVIY